jgi:hypothetical protein
MRHATDLLGQSAKQVGIVTASNIRAQRAVRAIVDGVRTCGIKWHVHANMFGEWQRQVAAKGAAASPALHALLKPCVAQKHRRTDYKLLQTSQAL